MMYAPHILERKITKPFDTDEDGNPMPGTGGECWERIASCKCYDFDVNRTFTVNGRPFEYKFRIVSERNDVKEGDYVRAAYPDGSIRGEGTVVKTMRTDYLNYSQLWLE